MSKGENQVGDFPPLLKGKLVVLDPQSKKVIDTISFQLNPEKLTRTLQIQASGKGGGARTEALRLIGAPKETIQLVVIIDALYTQSPAAEQDEALQVGIYPQLSALEGLLYPTTKRIKESMQDAKNGVLEIIPPQAPLTLLEWGDQRVLPVRLDNFSVTEQAYDINLNPIRAEVNMSLQVLNYDDWLSEQFEWNSFYRHHHAKEQLAKRRPKGTSGGGRGSA